MRRIVLPMSVSLDGFFAGPDGELDWQLISEELHQYFNEHLRTMSAFLDGRVTYELMAGFWPTAANDPASTPAMRDFSKIWRDMPKVVFSKTLERAGWNTTIVRDVVPEEIRELKREAGGDMALGGAVLAGEFLRLGLVDELRLYVHPVVVGEGRRLFPSGLHLALELAETRTFDNGVVMLRYDARAG